MSLTTNRTERPSSIRGLLLWSALIIISSGLLLYLTLGGVTERGGGLFLRPVATPAADSGLSPESAGDDVGPSPEERRGDSSGLWALWISGLTLVTSTVGLVFNAWLGWRKEIRDVQLDRLEIQQLRAELEKTLLEVQQLRDELTVES